MNKWLETIMVLGHSQDPDEAFVELRIHSLQVRQLNGLPQELLVEGQREASINVVPMEHCQAHDPSHKVEVRQVVLKHSISFSTGPNLTKLAVICLRHMTSKCWKYQS